MVYVAYRLSIIKKKKNGVKGDAEDVDDGEDAEEEPEEESKTPDPATSGTNIPETSEQIAQRCAISLSLFCRPRTTQAS